jgi:hypothetical protein
MIAPRNGESLRRKELSKKNLIAQVLIKFQIPLIDPINLKNI